MTLTFVKNITAIANDTLILSCLRSSVYFVLFLFLFGSVTLAHSARTRFDDNAVYHFICGVFWLQCRFLFLLVHYIYALVVFTPFLINCICLNELCFSFMLKMTPFFVQLLYRYLYSNNKGMHATRI